MNHGEPHTEATVQPVEVKQERDKPRDFWLVQYWWLLSCLAGLLIVVNLLVQYRWQWFDDYLVSEIVLGLIGLYLPWVAASIQRSTLELFPHIGADRPVPAWVAASIQRSTLGLLPHMQAISLSRRQANQRTLRRVRNAFHDPIQYFLAIFLALFGVATTQYIGIPWTGGVLALDLFWIGLVCAYVGIVAYYFVIALLLIYRLAGKTFRFEIFSSPALEIKKIYKTYMGFFWMGAALYVAAVVGISFSPIFWEVLYTPLGQLWVFPVAVLAIIFFLAIQVCIHLIQAKIKEQRLLRMEKLLAEHYRRWEADAQPGAGDPDPGAGRLARGGEGRNRLADQRGVDDYGDWVAADPVDFGGGGFIKLRGKVDPANCRQQHSLQGIILPQLPLPESGAHFLAEAGYRNKDTWQSLAAE